MSPRPSRGCGHGCGAPASDLRCRCPWRRWCDSPISGVRARRQESRRLTQAGSSSRPSASRPLSKAAPACRRRHRPAPTPTLGSRLCPQGPRARPVGGGGPCPRSDMQARQPLLWARVGARAVGPRAARLLGPRAWRWGDPWGAPRAPLLSPLHGPEGRATLGLDCHAWCHGLPVTSPTRPLATPHSRRVRRGKRPRGRRSRVTFQLLRRMEGQRPGQARAQNSGHLKQDTESHGQDCHPPAPHPAPPVLAASRAGQGRRAAGGCRASWAPAPRAAGQDGQTPGLLPPGSLQPQSEGRHAG